MGTEKNGEQNCTLGLNISLVIFLMTIDERIPRATNPSCASAAKFIDSTGFLLTLAYATVGAWSHAVNAACILNSVLSDALPGNS